MTWGTWLLYATTDAFAYLVPGLAVLFIVSQALGRGAGRSAWASAGTALRITGRRRRMMLCAIGPACRRISSGDTAWPIFMRGPGLHQNSFGIGIVV